MLEKYYVICPESISNAVVIDTLRELGVNTKVAESESTVHTRWIFVKNNSVVACYSSIDDSLLSKITIYTLSMLKQMKNRFCIDIPEGYEIDKENSTSECIKFKRKELTYDDIAKELFAYKDCFFIDTSGKIHYISNLEVGYAQSNNCISKKQAEKLLAINKLMNVAKYLNNGWKPDWNNANEKKYYITVSNTFSSNSKIIINHNYTTNNSSVYFRTEKFTEEAIRILGEDTIRLIYSTDY